MCWFFCCRNVIGFFFQPEQLVNLLFTIQQRDSAATSHPISVEVNKPSEISSIFDDISYGKGGSVIRMVNYFLGNDTFNRGITVNTYILP